MKFYNDTKPFYLETDALLQLCDNTTCQKDRVPDNVILCPIAFVSKSLTQAEGRYSNIEGEALDISHGLKKFRHYCFGREVLIITDYKPLVSMFKKDVTTLSQCIQCTLLKIHQYRVQIIYKPGPKIFIADWLSWHNHIKGKDRPIKEMEIMVNAIRIATDILACVPISQIQQASAQDDHLQCLKKSYNCRLAQY